MRSNDTKIKSVLLSGNYVTEEDVQQAESAAISNRVSFVDALFSKGTLTKDLLGQAMAESFGVPYADLNSHPPTRESALALPIDMAQKFRAVLFSGSPGKYTVATDDPDQPGLKEAIESALPGNAISFSFSLSEDIDAVFSMYHRKTLETRFSKIIESDRRVAPEILREILSDALSFKASDIHFEPEEDSVLVRFRVDGVLQSAGRLPREYYATVLNRIKVESRLRIDEHFAAQDGSMRFEGDGVAADFRTSIIPTVNGEKTVLRALSAYVEGFALDRIGLSERHQTIVSEAIRKPFGMVLVVGPTGSGKTTTLYALLRLLNTPEVNITTIEDPVEYKLSGVNQIQVRESSRLTFAEGLRSIVRQDPDIILVGEIRDKETAEIAVNAALTGHLLLSTFHANDAATAIPRLLDMGSEPFLLASTLEVIVAERLLRKVCESCRVSVPVSALPQDVSLVFRGALGAEANVYRGKGCGACGGTGYSGRTAIFECIRMTPDMRNLILTAPSTKEVWELARKEGSISLFEDGLEKVRNGITTPEELLRVAEPPLDMTK